VNEPDWEERNNAYLAAALHWLRLRLDRLAGRAGTLDHALATAAAALDAAAACSPPPALRVLADRFGLTPFEQQLLLLCAAPEFDPRIGPLCAAAQQDPARPYPTFALAFALFDDPAWDALSPERPLRFWRLLEIHRPAAQALTASALRADERVVSVLKGLDHLDERLAPFVEPLRGTDGDAAPSQAAVTGQVLRALGPVRAPGDRLVLLLGPDSLAKQAVARRVADTLGLTALALPAGVLPTAAADLEEMARLWRREATLLPLALYLEAGEPPEPGRAAALGRFLVRAGGLAFVATREPWLDLPDAIAVGIGRPTPAEQRTAWTRLLGAASADSAARLAAQFDLPLAEIRAATRLASSGDDAEDLPARAWRASRERTRPRLDQLAQRITPRAGWTDLVLPDAELRQLRQIAAQAAQRTRVYDDWGFRDRTDRGLGISALFAGESGTGKTLAAEVVAHALALDLFCIDLASVVSKYVGETEKNLRRLFDAAEDGGAILFFDEADALFGRRSEVKDSHDRYANVEISYLLQRMESYRGVAILATNLKTHLDPAFLRRLRFVVNFPFPGAAERLRLWRQAFPARAPVNGLDWERLARLNLTGGNIRNVALNAAFVAAAAGSPITLPMVLDCVRSELRKLDRPVSESELRWPEAVAG